MVMVEIGANVGGTGDSYEDLIIYNEGIRLLIASPGEVATLVGPGEYLVVHLQ